MKVSCLLFFIVFSQYKRESVSLPTTGIKKVFKLPKTISSETEIIINGTMKILNNIFYVALLDKQKKSLCELTYDTYTNNVTMTSELSGPVSDEYFLENSNSLLPAPFSLKIEPKMSRSRHLINLFFEADDAGQLSLVPCEIKNFESVHRIVVKGADRINSLVFTFKN
ncbi:uncharacterized protein [Battus philenor]|uniref:uncharacterized protein n=1 Tax=Battus philenor TaxID=42288 RepID=UPI0035CF5CF9